MSLAFRPASGSDWTLIRDSFLSSYIDSHAAGLIAASSWRRVMAEQLQTLAARPGSETIVAYKPDEEPGCSDLYGWIMVERGHMMPFVVYVYVLAAYRRWGVARALFRAAGIDPEEPFHYAGKTGVVARLRDKGKIPRAVFDPLRVRYAKESHEPHSRQATPGPVTRP